MSEQSKQSLEGLIRNAIRQSEEEYKIKTEGIPIAVKEMKKYSSIMPPGVLTLFEWSLLESTARVKDGISIMKMLADLAHLLETMKLNLEEHDEVYKDIQAIIETRRKEQEEIVQKQEEIRKRKPTPVV